MMKPILSVLLMAFVSCTSAFAENMVSGTGFFITADGYIATNNHVVDNTSEIAIRDFHENVYKVTVVRRDVANDVAILKITEVNEKASLRDVKPSLTGFPALPIRPSIGVLKGESAFTVGFPRPELQGDEAKITEGIISSLSGIEGEPNHFQISVPIQPGNSGGPLIDKSGHVIGLTSSHLLANATLRTDGSLPENVNYAVKSNYLLELASTVPGLLDKLPKQTGNKVKPFTEAAADAEHAVVFILAVKGGDTEDAGSQATPKGIPKYEADAALAEMYRQAGLNYQSKEYFKALQLYGKAAELGYAPAQAALGLMYERGEGVSRDPQEAIKWYKKGAAGGNPDAQIYLTNCYSYGWGVEKNYAEALKWYNTAAESGYAPGQYSLGLLYEEGRGVGKDLPAAFHWYVKAAAQNHSNAEMKVGFFYASGWSVARDYVEAVKWYNKAVAAGNATAENNLGVMYENGYGIGKDLKIAAAWYYKAATHGNVFGRANVGRCYLNGLGIDRDYPKALKWLDPAANAGNAAAQYNLGRMYANGWGTAKDVALATTWYRKSAAQGNREASAALSELGAG